MTKRKRKWQNYIDEKAHIIAAGIDQIIPINASSSLKWRASHRRSLYPDSTHAILETKADIAAPQIIGIFINDHYKKGLRYILVQDKLYKLIARRQGTVKIPETWTGMICLVKEEDQESRDYITALVKKVGVHKILNNGKIIELSTHATADQ